MAQSGLESVLFGNCGSGTTNQIDGESRKRRAGGTDVHVKTKGGNKPPKKKRGENKRKTADKKGKRKD